MSRSDEEAALSDDELVRDAEFDAIRRNEYLRSLKHRNPVFELAVETVPKAKWPVAGKPAPRVIFVTEQGYRAALTARTVMAQRGAEQDHVTFALIPADQKAIFKASLGPAYTFIDRPDIALTEDAIGLCRGYVPRVVEMISSSQDEPAQREGPTSPRTDQPKAPEPEEGEPFGIRFIARSIGAVTPRLAEGAEKNPIFMKHAQRFMLAVAGHETVYNERPWTLHKAVNPYAFVWTKRMPATAFYRDRDKDTTARKKANYAHPEAGGITAATTRMWNLMREKGVWAAMDGHMDYAAALKAAVAAMKKGGYFAATEESYLKALIRNSEQTKEFT